jgi:SulP family sulfate permease
MSVSLPDSVGKDAALNRVFSTLIAGIICGFLAIVLSIGHGSLLFSSNLRAYLPVAIGLALFSTAVMAAAGALTSSIRGVVAITQEIPIVALVTVVNAVAAAVPAGASEEARLATVVVSIAISTIVTGAAALALGYFRLGSLIRFAPYPVVGGFLAGTGWLIVVGGVGLVMNGPVTFDSLGGLDDGILTKIGLTTVFVLALFAGQARGSDALVLPGIILIALLAFNIATAILGMSTDTLRADGWLISLPESGKLWPPIGIADLANVEWRAIAAGLIGMPTVVILTMAALLMNATGIELDSNRDVDLDQELRSVGIMNLLAGAGMGLTGYNSVSLTLLASRLGAATQWIGIIVALLTVSALVLGGVVLDTVPTVILGGVLIWIGGSLIIEWLILSYRRLDNREYLVILLIFVIIVGVDFAVGILAGLAAALVLFAFEYGRLDIVRHEMFGSGYQSGGATTERRREALRQHGGAILIIRLQGFLFFGTADRLRRRIQERIATADKQRIRFLVIDFGRVTGVDSSGVLSFVRLQQIAAREDLAIVFTGMSETARRALLRGGIGAADRPVVRFETDLERGLRWGEDTLLAGLASEAIGEGRRDLITIVNDIVNDETMAHWIASYFQRIEALPGSRLIEQGTPSNDILFVETGHLAVEMEAGPRRPPIHLATVGPGAILGEIAFYLGELRTASIIAEDNVVAWTFSRNSLLLLQAEVPEAALRFHESMAAMLARRLAQTNRLVRVLAD